MLEAAHKGSIKALFMLSAGSWRDGTAALVRRSLHSCRFLVMCATLPSEISRYADVLLPAVTFAETAGTYTNTERRIQLVQQALPPQGDAKPQWRILAELAQRLCPSGARRLVEGVCPGWEYGSTSEIMDEIASLTPIYAGVSHARLQQAGPLTKVEGSLSRSYLSEPSPCRY
jgi:predicted molibdopterin-dependent oxidoreductase YjgC